MWLFLGCLYLRLFAWSSTTEIVDLGVVGDDIPSVALCDVVCFVDDAAVSVVVTEVVLSVVVSNVLYLQLFRH